MSSWGIDRLCGLGEECGSAIVGIEREISTRLMAKSRSTELENMLVDRGFGLLMDVG